MTQPWPAEAACVAREMKAETPRWARGAVSRAKTPLRSAWRRSVLRRGTDVTSWSASRSALVLAPHPDDETIGCGATIARKRASGTDVHVAVVCDGRSSHPHSEHVTPDELAELRAIEVVAACGQLGVEASDMTLLGHPDESIADNRDALAAEIDELVGRLQPDEIYVPSPLDWHPDHVALNRVARATLSGRPEVSSMLEYPVWFWAEGPWTPPLAAGWIDKVAHLVGDPLTAARDLQTEKVSTAGFVDRKRAAIGAHRTQTQNVTGESSWATLPASWFEPFLGESELFFRVARSSAS